MNTTVHPGRRQRRDVDRTSDLARLGRLRWAVRAVLILGVAASIAANVLHAHPNLISQLIAGWPPLALLLTVELTSRVPADTRGLAAARLISAVIIAGIAAWVSYWHMVGVAARYGETSAHANYLLPLSVDGLVVVASISLVEIAGRINRSHHAPGGNPIPDAVPAAATSTTGVTQLPAGIPATASAGSSAPLPTDAVTGEANGATPADRILLPPRESIFGSGRQSSAPGNREDRQHPPDDLDAVDGLSTATQLDKPTAAGPPQAADEATAPAQLRRDSSAAAPSTDGGTAADHDGQRPLHQAAYGDASPVAAPMDTRRNRHDQHPHDVSTSRRKGDPARPRSVEAGNDSDVNPRDHHDHAVPSETAAAVAYWYRRDPQMHPADIAAKIGRSERTVRRYWPPEPEPVNGARARDRRPDPASLSPAGQSRHTAPTRN